MLQNYSRYRILQEFFDFPKKDFQIRELSRRIKIAQPSVMNHLDALMAEGYIIKEKKGVYPSFRANLENDKFKLLKKQNLVWRMQANGLINEIDSKAKPNCILLFGSASKGEDSEDSDVDLFVQSEAKNISLVQYEKSLNRKVNILFEPEIKNLSKELLNNILNGDKLYGYIKAL